MHCEINRKNWLVELVIFLPGLALIVSASAAQDKMAEHIILKSRLGWAQVGVWLDEDSILLTDHSQGLVNLHDDGKVFLAPGLNRLSFLHGATSAKFQIRPGAVRRGQGGEILLEDKGGGSHLRVLSLNKDDVANGNGSATVDLYWSSTLPKHQNGQARPGTTGRAITLGALYDWQPLDTGILGFGDFCVGGCLKIDEWFSSFFFSPGKDEFVLIGEQITSEHWYTSERDYYTREISYVATHKNRGYLLRFKFSGEAYDYLQPQLLEVNSSGELLGVRDLDIDDFGRVPRFTTPVYASMSAYERAFDNYRDIENSKTIIGLYGSAEGVFALAKHRNTRETGTIWHLFQLDLWHDDQQRLEGKQEVSGESVVDAFAVAELPSSSPHLAVIPPSQGSHVWAFVERGRVEKLGVDMKVAYRPADSIVLVEPHFEPHR